MARSDLYATITKRILACLEEGHLPGIGKPWKDRIPQTPMNIFTGNPLTGVNALLLWQTAEEKAFSQDRWLTFLQAKKLGGTVRAKESGTTACMVKSKKRTVLDENGDPELDEDGNPKECHYPYLDRFTLFNVDQCDLPDEVLNQPSAGPDMLPVDKFIHGCGVEILHSESRDRACYIPSRDQIVLPTKDRFQDSDSYYSVALHELTHASGHESRLAREAMVEKSPFGSELYAFEELVAQFGSAFLCGSFGLRNEAFDASYIGSWMKILEADNRAIFRATNAARLAADYLKQTYQDNCLSAHQNQPKAAEDSYRPQLDSQDIELFGHQWPLGNIVKLDPTVERSKLRAQIFRLKQMGYELNSETQTWVYSFSAAAAA